ncbi:unnamed protein product [Hymenolepis diminuta]|uniref:BRO1 domain-containing protein n=1 Tax=Hymenolepis diminuta TaxID=6216 RepID=A0A0R3SSK9_HYMDI|nr:unnamed protein product [Hymenolepis diminuta]
MQISTKKVLGNYRTYVAKSLAGEEAYEYAAVFTLGKAKCESMSGKSLAEAAALMEAGRLFARAEENLQTTSAFSSGEFLENALSCFLKAAKLKVTEVYRVLLVLFTLPPKSKAISKDGPMSLSPYIDENGEITQGSIAEYLDEDLFINLKSLILAHTSEDLNSLDITASFLQACLDSTQRGILQDLVEQATNPPDDVL